MARAPYPDPETLPEKVRETLADAPPFNIFRMLARAEAQMRPFMRLGSANFQELALSDRRREIAILCTARATNANYEWAHHVTIALRVEIDEVTIDAIKQENWDALGEDDRIIADFATSTTRDVRASDAAYSAAQELLGARQTVELLLVVGYYNMVARFLETMDVDLEDKYVNRLR